MTATILRMPLPLPLDQGPNAAEQRAFYGLPEGPLSADPVDWSNCPLAQRYPRLRGIKRLRPSEIKALSC